MSKRELLSSMWERVAEIRDGMSKMEENLYVISDCIDAKKFLSPEVSGSVMENLNKIEKAGAFCRDNYEELSGDAFSFDKIEDLEENLKKIDIVLGNQEEIELAKRFAELTCDDEDSAKALGDAQTKLAEIIGESDSLALAKDDAALAAMKPFAHFMKAFDEKRMVNVLDYIADLRKEFDDELVAALLDHQIKAPAEETAEAEEAVEEVAEEVAEAADEAVEAVEGASDDIADAVAEITEVVREIAEEEAEEPDEAAVEVTDEAEPSDDIPDAPADEEPAIEIPVDGDADDVAEIPVEEAGEAEEPALELPVDEDAAEPEIPAEAEEADIVIPINVEEGDEPDAVFLPNLDEEIAEPSIDAIAEEPEDMLDPVLPDVVEEADEPIVEIPAAGDEPEDIADPIADSVAAVENAKPAAKPETKEEKPKEGGFFSRWF
ncbi:MAG: hypothetical protein IJM57_00740 [Lachnospiraceae bacterium]|nr:hypothetical protein [Lachnospiraceae bacterium]